MFVWWWVLPTFYKWWVLGSRYGDQRWRGFLLLSLANHTLHRLHSSHMIFSTYGWFPVTSFSKWSHWLSKVIKIKSKLLYSYTYLRIWLKPLWLHLQFTLLPLWLMTFFLLPNLKFSPIVVVCIGCSLTCNFLSLNVLCLSSAQGAFV